MEILMGSWNVSALILVACGAIQTLGSSSVLGAAGAETRVTATEKLDAALVAQSDETKVRYQYRHPKETLQFFGVEPGMTVVDTLPGPVWYSTILSDYLGADGHVIGADYDLEMRTAMGGRYASEEFQQERQDWPQRWVRERELERKENEAPFSAFFYGSLPEEMVGTADVVLMVRSAHGPNQTEKKGGFFTEALENISRILKPGGVVGVIQHRAPENSSDEWANGQNGYLKQTQLIEFFENAGFEFVASSEINANPKDAPTEEEAVWRLPPTLRVDDVELRAKMKVIGESDRMTLKFRKP